MLCHSLLFRNKKALTLELRLMPHCVAGCGASRLPGTPHALVKADDQAALPRPAVGAKTRRQSDLEKATKGVSARVS